MICNAKCVLTIRRVKSAWCVETVDHQKCGKRTHTCSLIITQSSCQACRDTPLIQGGRCRYCRDLCKMCLSKKKKSDTQGSCDDPECGLREKIFEGEDALIQFCQWAISTWNKNKRFLSLNCSGFDTHLVLNYCVEYAKIEPEVCGCT